MKLKTLKDIECKGCLETEEYNNIECDEIKDYRKKVKQEVIKWYHRSDDDKHKFIKEFFNITEEDLKHDG